MGKRHFKKEELIIYANQKYSVLHSNGATIKLISEGEKVRYFKFADPKTGERKSIEMNTIYCDTDSPYLRPIEKEEES